MATEKEIKMKEVTRMDDTDKDILQELIADGKARIKTISKKLALPMSTVHHRILGMEKDGIIKKYAAIPDYKKLGLPILAYVFVSVDYSKITSQDAVARELRRIPNVLEANIVSGEIDIIAKVRAKDVDEMTEVIISKMRNVKGVAKTVTSVVMREIQSDFSKNPPR